MPKIKNEDAFHLQRIMLTITGVWPLRNPTLFYKIRTLFVIFILATATNVALLMSLYTGFGNASLRLQASFLSVDFICYQLKLIIFHYKRQTFLKLLDDLENPLFYSYSKSMEIYPKQTVKITTTIVKLFLCSCILTISSFILLPIFDNKHKRNLPLPFPFDLTHHTVIFYLLAYIFQSMALIIGAWNSVAFDNLASSIMGIASAQLKILGRTIELATSVDYIVSSKSYYQNTQVENKVCRKLKMCVLHHMAVIELTTTTEDIFKYVFLMQFLTSIVVICFTGFTFATAPPGSLQFLFSISFFGSLMIEIAIGCVYADDVTNQSAKIQDACYMSEWICCGPKVRKYLFLMMERSKRPLTLTAGKFVTLSFASLLNILKSALSYSAVLRRLYSES